MVTPNEAAGKLGVTRTTVMRWIKSGKLQAERRNYGWNVSEDSVNNLLQPNEILDEYVPERFMNESSLREAVELKIRISELEATLDGKEELIGQLREEISHLRRPFWKRVLDL